MKFPVCQVCLKNEILCNGCAEKMGQAEIKIDEINMFRQLNKILGSQKSLENVEIRRAVGKRNLIVVTRKDDISKLVGKDGSNVKKLAKELEVPIRIVVESDDIKNFVTEVLFTVPIMGINILYTPEGIMYRVRVPLSHRTKLPISSEILASMSRSLFNVDIDIIFE